MLNPHESTTSRKPRFRGVKRDSLNVLTENLVDDSDSFASGSDQWEHGDEARNCSRSTRHFNFFCHRSLENRPLIIESKPASDDCSCTFHRHTFQAEQVTSDQSRTSAQFFGLNASLIARM